MRINRRALLASGSAFAASAAYSQIYVPGAPTIGVEGINVAAGSAYQGLVQTVSVIGNTFDTATTTVTPFVTSSVTIPVPTNGWMLLVQFSGSPGTITVSSSTGPTYPSSNSLVQVVVQRHGFDTSGNATTYNDTLFGTVQPRRPFYQAATTTSLIPPSTSNAVYVALDGQIYATDNVVSVTFLNGFYTGQSGNIIYTSANLTASGSQRLDSAVYPPAIVKPYTPPFAYMGSGGSITVEITADHLYARNGSAVAAVWARCIQGATTGPWTVVSAMAASSIPATVGSNRGTALLAVGGGSFGGPTSLPCANSYSLTLAPGSVPDSTSAGSNGIQYRVFPWCGPSWDSVANGDALQNGLPISLNAPALLPYCQDTAAAHAPIYAWINQSGLTGASAAIATSLPGSDPGATFGYATEALAIAAATTYNNTFRGHNDPSGLVMLYRDVSGSGMGDYTTSYFTYATVAATNAINPVQRVSYAYLTSGTTNTNCRIAGTTSTAGAQTTPTFAVASGTYNTATGAVVLAMTGSTGVAVLSSATVSLTGTGSVASIVGPYTCTTGTGGTTIKFTAATGLGAITITGGTLVVALIKTWTGTLVHKGIIYDSTSLTTPASAAQTVFTGSTTQGNSATAANALSFLLHYDCDMRMDNRSGSFPQNQNAGWQYRTRCIIGGIGTNDGSVVATDMGTTPTVFAGNVLDIGGVYASGATTMPSLVAATLAAQWHLSVQTQSQTQGPAADKQPLIDGIIIDGMRIDCAVTNTSSVFNLAQLASSNVAAPLVKGAGIRNVLLRSVSPSTSSSFMQISADTNSGNLVQNVILRHQGTDAGLNNATDFNGHYGRENLFYCNQGWQQFPKLGAFQYNAFTDLNMKHDSMNQPETPSQNSCGTYSASLQYYQGCIVKDTVATAYYQCIVTPPGANNPPSALGAPGAAASYGADGYWASAGTTIGNAAPGYQSLRTGNWAVRFGVNIWGNAVANNSSGSVGSSPSQFSWTGDAWARGSVNTGSVAGGGNNTYLSYYNTLTGGTGGTFTNWGDYRANPSGPLYSLVAAGGAICAVDLYGAARSNLGDGAAGPLEHS